MWKTVSSIVIKYWVEFLLGLIVTGGSFLVKRYIKLDKAERERAQEAHYKKLEDSMEANDKKLIEHFSSENEKIMNIINDKYTEITTRVQDAMIKGRDESYENYGQIYDRIKKDETNFDVLKNGILSIQGSMFKEECRRLLEEGHEITLREWEDIDADHDVYKSLGGNHNGDYLYSLVSEKVKQTLTIPKKEEEKK